jgi:hypothetical protein
MQDTAPSLLVLACGALAHEIVAVLRASGWTHVAVQCLPAALHNTPAEIPEKVRAALVAARGKYERVFVAYADCGTGGELDRVLRDEGAERIPGAHCYEFLAGSRLFAELAEEEPGTFFLTDFLARHFDRLVIKGLGLDRHPELLPLYFGNYRRLVYLSQSDSADLRGRAKEAAARLKLAFEHRHVGHDNLATVLTHGIKRISTNGETDRRLLA